MPIGQLGMAAIDIGKNAANAGLGLMLQRSQDKRQLNMSRKLQRMQMEGDKELTNYNFQKQLEMWQATGYGAQMKQIKEAGLNPALLYGMGGGGGQTANVAQGKTTTGNAPVGGGEIQAIMGMGLQRELLNAQKDLIQAQADNIKADTANKPKTGANIEASTASLLQGIENQKAQEELTKVQTSIASIDEHIKGKTQNAAVDIIFTELQKAKQVLESMTRENRIGTATEQTKIGIIKQELANKIIEWWKTNAEIGHITQQVIESMNKVQMEIQKNMREWDRLSLDTQQNTLDRYDQMMKETGFPSELAGIVSSIFGGMVGSKLTTPGEKPRTEVKGLHNRN